MEAAHQSCGRATLDDFCDKEFWVMQWQPLLVSGKIRSSVLGLRFLFPQQNRSFLGNHRSIMSLVYLS